MDIRYIEPDGLLTMLNYIWGRVPPDCIKGFIWGYKSQKRGLVIFWGVQRKENHIYAKTNTIDVTLKKPFPGEQFYHYKGIGKSIPRGMVLPL